MSKIEIETCKRTSNYCAPEAVAKVMRNNYMQRRSGGYQHENTVKVSSGSTLRVIEEPADLHTKSPCSCKFRVEGVDGTI